MSSRYRSLQFASGLPIARQVGNHETVRKRLRHGAIPMVVVLILQAQVLTRIAS